MRGEHTCLPLGLRLVQSPHVSRHGYRGLTLCVALVGRLAMGSPEVDAYLRSATALYQALDFEEALVQLAQARKVASGIDDTVAIHLLEGIAQAQLNRLDEAEGSFLAALSLRPEVPLPLAVPPKVMRLFEQERERARARALPQPTAAPASPAVSPSAASPEPPVVARGPLEPAGGKGLGVAGIAGGAVAVAGGSFLVVDALSFNPTKATLTSSQAQTAHQRATVELAGGYAAIGVGAAAAAWGTYLLVRSPLQQAHLVPVLEVGHMGLAALGCF
jgi:hypothetical protein